jgi:hypothetical protein
MILRHTERERQGHIVMSQITFGVLEREEKETEDHIALQSSNFDHIRPGKAKADMIFDATFLKQRKSRHAFCVAVFETEKLSFCQRKVEGEKATRGERVFIHPSHHGRHGRSCT